MCSNLESFVTTIIIAFKLLFPLLILFCTLHLIAGVIDSSGLAFTYIKEQREHDAGVLIFGRDSETLMTIPPMAESYTVSAHCHSECTEEVCVTNITFVLS